MLMTIGETAVCQREMVVKLKKNNVTQRKRYICKIHKRRICWHGEIGMDYRFAQSVIEQDPSHPRCETNITLGVVHINYKKSCRETQTGDKVICRWTENCNFLREIFFICVAQEITRRLSWLLTSPNYALTIARLRQMIELAWLHVPPDHISHMFQQYFY